MTPCPGSKQLARIPVRTHDGSVKPRGAETLATCPVCLRQIAVMSDSRLRVHVRVSRKMLNAQRRRIDLLQVQLAAAEKALAQMERFYRADRP